MDTTFAELLGYRVAHLWLRAGLLADSLLLEDDPQKMNDDRGWYERFFFGMSHVIWVPALVVVLIWMIR